MNILGKGLQICYDLLEVYWGSSVFIQIYAVSHENIHLSTSQFSNHQPSLQNSLTSISNQKISTIIIIYTHLYIIVSFSITSSIIHFQIQGTCNIMGNINRHTAPCAIAGPQEAPNKYREQSFGEPYAEPDGAKGRSWTFRLVCGLWLCVRTEHLEIDRD